MSKKSSTFAPAFERKRVSLAQLVEQLTLNQWVEGSSPSGDTTRSHPLRGWLSLWCFPMLKLFDIISRICTKCKILNEAS